MNRPQPQVRVLAMLTIADLTRRPFAIGAGLLDRLATMTDEACAEAGIPPEHRTRVATPDGVLLTIEDSPMPIAADVVRVLAGMLAADARHFAADHAIRRLVLALDYGVVRLIGGAPHGTAVRRCGLMAHDPAIPRVAGDPTGTWLAVVASDEFYTDVIAHGDIDVQATAYLPLTAKQDGTLGHRWLRLVSRSDTSDPIAPADPPVACSAAFEPVPPAWSPPTTAPHVAPAASVQPRRTVTALDARELLSALDARELLSATDASEG